MNNLFVFIVFMMSSLTCKTNNMKQ